MPTSVFAVFSIALCLALAIGSSEAWELQQERPQHSPRVGDELEWSLTAVDAEWLSPSVTATPFMVITEADGSRWIRPAFIYQQHRTDPSHRQGEFEALGERHLRIRHSPRINGSLSWALYAPAADPETMQPLASDSLAVLPAARPPGPIGQSPHNNRLLSFADGTPFIPIGPNMAWALGRDRLATFIGHLERLQAVGGNHIRVWCASWFAQIEGDAPLAWRLDQAWLLDQVLREAGQRGIAVTLVLDNHHDFQQGSAFPYGATVGERAREFFNADLPAAYRERLRYLHARYGHLDSILAWELFNEIDLSGAERFRLVNWTASALEFLQGIDSYGRLRTISWAGDDWPQMRALGRLSLLQVHRYVPHLDNLQPSEMDIIATMTGDAVPLIESRRPFLFAEVGHHGANNDDTPGNDIDRDGLILVHKAWAGFLLGGAGPGMNWWWDTWIDSNDLWHLYRPLADTIARIDWRDGALRPMDVPLDGDFRVLGWQSRNQALMWPHSVHDNWYRRLLREDGNGDHPHLGKRFALTLSGLEAEQTFAVTGIHMISGAITYNATYRSSRQGTLTLNLPPHRGDQVLVVRSIP